MQFQNDEELNQYIIEHKIENAKIYQDPSYCTAIVGFSLDGRAIYNFFDMITYVVEVLNKSTDEALDYLDEHIKINDEEGGPIIILEEFE